MAKFEPGKSGNPKGRGSETDQQKRVAKELLSPYAVKAAERIGRDVSSEDPDLYQWAIKMVFEYVFGKPNQAVDLKPGEGASFKLIIEAGGE